MGLWLKPGVRLENLSPQMLLGLHIAEEVYEGHGYPCRVTSIYRPEALLHATGQAADLGIRDGNGEIYPDDVLDSIIEELHRRLGKKYGGQYDIVDERSAPGGPHLHCEWDPK